MMQQYRRLKAQVPHGALMLFRLGDFYEMFFEDAKTGARVLGLTLTQRNGIPMCGLPFHAATPYISRLINAGYRVALCDQMETPKPGQMVRREITQIISPGSVVEIESLDSRRANYLAALCPADGRYGFAFLDTSTGDFRLTELPDGRHLADELAKIAPAELVIPDGWEPDPSVATTRAPGACAAACSARALSGSLTATTRAPPQAASVATWAVPITPAPMTPMPIMRASRSSACGWCPARPRRSGSRRRRSAG